jgi:hypothetical protein
MSGEINIPTNASDSDAPSSGRLVIFAKADGLYIRRAGDAAGLRLRLGADDTSSSQLLNNDTSTLQYGNVVIWDSSANTAVKLTSTQGDYRVAGVVNALTIAPGNVGGVMTQAGEIVDVLCDTAAVSRGMFLIASATPGRATANGYWKTDNAFAVALSAKAAGSEGTVQAMLMHGLRTVIAGNAGWAMGGLTTVVTNNTQKLTFTNGTWASIPGAAMPTALYQQAGLGYGITAGYSIGGYDSTTNYATAYKVSLASETTGTANGANLGTARRNLRYGHNAADKGWAVGGWTTGAVSNTDKITFATDLRSAGANLSVVDNFRAGVGDGTQIFTAGNASPTNRILVGTETIATWTDANITPSPNYCSMAFPVGYGYYVQGTSGAKINFASGVGSGGPAPAGAHNVANGVTDGLTIGYVAGNNASPYDTTERFNPATETFSSAGTMSIGKSNAAVFSTGAY